jgi:hypothetical protein
MIQVAINTIPSMSYRHVECVDDTMHQVLEPANAWLKDNPDERNTMVTVLVVASDCLFGALMCDWLLNCKSWRLPIALVLLIACKELSAVSFPNWADKLGRRLSN